MIRLPDFLIIGAMKCATSTLHEQLAAQPGVFMSTPKEPCFFSDDEQWSRGVQWYASLFDDARPDDRCGESSTHYTKLPTFPHTVQRIRDTIGRDVSLIYMMRHPIDRLISQYIHEWSQQVIPANMTIDEMVHARPEFVDYGRYAYQLQPFIDTFGQQRILPVFFEHFIADGPSELRRVAAFLNLPGPVRWVDDLQQRNVSRERLRRSALRNMVLNSAAVRSVIRSVVPRSVRDRVKARWSMQQRPVLSPAVRADLEGLYDEDLAQLGAWFGCTLTCANFREVARDAVPQWSSVAEEALS